jgi:hypothetical protein
MTITLGIRPEVQAELARQAAAHGQVLEAHAAKLLEEAIDIPAAADLPVFDTPREQRANASASCERASLRSEV